MANNREKTPTQINLIRNPARRTRVHSNRTAERLPIRHPTHHRLPNTDYNLRSNPDRLHTLLQEERRTHSASFLPDRMVRSNTTHTSILLIPLLQLQPTNNRNRQDHAHDLQDTCLGVRRNGNDYTCLHAEKSVRRLSQYRSPANIALNPRIVLQRH